MLIFHWIAEVIHNSRYWAYNTRSDTKRQIFLDTFKEFVDVESDMAAVYNGITGQRVDILHQNIKTFKFSHDFFRKLSKRIENNQEDLPEQMNPLIEKIKTLCYKTHSRISMR